MGEGDLWDDFALISAFDDAIFKYKKMNHQIPSEEAASPDLGDSSAEEAKPTTHLHDDAVAVAVADAHPPSSQLNDSINEYSYDQLLAHYYELEFKRAQLLEKLHQHGYWNYQTPRTQHPYPSNTQVSHSVDSCHSFVPSNSASSLGGAFNDHPPEDCDVTKTAMEASRKALSCLKLETSSISIPQQEKNEDGTRSSETDLSDVLNAWYSAGFYTGKYLAEKSTRDREKRQK